MRPEDWHRRWAEGRIGFHRSEVNPNLRAYVHRLGLEPGARVFVPLCGKSVDLPWLAAQGIEPVGVELSERAVASLFAESGVEPVRCARGPLTMYRGGGMRVYAGDFFDLDARELGTVAAAWDRAALIALPADSRPDYACHLAALIPGGARLLLVTMAYPDAGVEGPPFSVAPAEVESLYAPWFDISALERDVAVDAPGDLRSQGIGGVHESAWLLIRNDTSA